MSKGKGKAKPVDTLRVDTQKAATAAAPVSEQAKKVDDYNSRLWDVYTGKTAFDVKSLPNSNILLPLYTAATQRADKRVGTGLNYGEGSNPAHIAAIQTQLDDERARAAAGQLEQNVFNTFAGLEGKMLGLGEIDQAARSNNFNRQLSLYGTEAGLQAQRDAKPKWWETMLGAGLGAAGQWAAGGFQTGKPKVNSSAILHESLHSF